MVANTRRIQFPKIGVSTGYLTAIESGQDIPFAIKRVYYITDVPQDTVRGLHSHRKLEQVLLCISGSVKIRVKTPYEEQIIQMNQSNNGLFIGHMVWREMFDFSPGSVLLVLASEHYTESDYIRSYEEYQTEAIAYFGGSEK